MPGVALELAVGEGSLLERSEATYPVVRLPEHPLPEHADCDEQHGSAHEREEQLGLDLGRQAADSSDERIVAPAERPPVLDDYGSSLLRCLSFRQGLRGSARSILPPCW